MSNSPFFSRSLFSRNGASAPVLPFHSSNQHRLRHQPSEYNLDELQPRPEVSDIFPTEEPRPEIYVDTDHSPETNETRTSMPPRGREPPNMSSAYPFDRKDHDPYSYPYRSNDAPPPRVLFSRPPPPIASSVLMYRDVEEGGMPGRSQKGEQLLPPSSSGSGQPWSALPTSSLLFDRPTRRAPKVAKKSYDTDSTWTVLQRRQRALQKETQTYLDLQSAGLSAGLGRGGEGMPLRPPGSSDAGSATPTGDSFVSSRHGGSASHLGGSSGRPGGSRLGESHLRLPTDRSTPSGAIIPVRQPRPKKTGLRGARAGLSRSIAMLADLKAEEDAALSAALNTRKRALVQLRKLSGRRDNIAGELRTLENDDDDENQEPLARELATLRRAHTDTDRQIADLEAQLSMLKTRRRTLETRMSDVQSQREAGLSGYRGALKEVDAQLANVLRRPPVQPLDVEALGVNPGGGSRDGESNGEDAESATGGEEFMRLRPERRTAEMARFWWQNEVSLLERRQAEVDTERTALEEGGAVWREAVKLVSDFESGLRKQMADEEGEDQVVADTSNGSDPKGKARMPTPEERMQSQLQKMDKVLEGLARHLSTAEDKGWNLLICAIGAELEAFQEARQMLQGALEAAGFDIKKKKEEEEDGEGGGRSSSSGHGLIDSIIDSNDNNHDSNEEDTSETPRLARSANEALAAATATARSSPVKSVSARTTAASMFIQRTDSHRSDPLRKDDRKDEAASESEDNDVPAGLLVSTHVEDEHPSRHGEEEEEDDHQRSSARDEHHDKDDSSENEVPPEFLAEQSDNQD